MDPDFAEKLSMGNAFFSFIFNVEMVLKLIALQGEYFRSSWNLLDMFIVVSADIGLLFTYFSAAQGGGASSKAITILRAFRILRVVKLLQKMESIKVIIDAVINILPNITNVMSLFVLALFIYSCVGMSLFSVVRSRGEGLDKKNNFQTFGGAMLILMRFATGEDWNAFMYELQEKTDCRVSFLIFSSQFFYRTIKTTQTSKRMGFKAAEAPCLSPISLVSKLLR
jgi:voltage-dependent calcium channel L type alpha-1D